MDNGSGWYMGNVHLHDMWQSRTKAQVNEAGKYQGAIVVASSIPFEKLSNELLMDIKLIVNNVKVYCISIKLSTKHSVNNFYIVQVLMKNIL